MKQAAFDRVQRLLDILISLGALIVLAPLLLTTALLVRFKLGSPIFFVHERAGYRGHRFPLYKFRTLLDERDTDGRELSFAERLTPFGSFLRKMSLDELPQLLNVLKGDVSIVGPRPLPPHYLPRYTPEQTRRHEARPGVTGWAQVNGRNEISWEEKFKLDVWYVDHRSLPLYFKIIFLTAIKVLMREGINSNPSKNMPEFTGT